MSTWLTCQPRSRRARPGYQPTRAHSASCQRRATSRSVTAARKAGSVMSRGATPAFALACGAPRRTRQQGSPAPSHVRRGCCARAPPRTLTPSHGTQHAATRVTGRRQAQAQTCRSLPNSPPRQSARHAMGRTRTLQCPGARAAERQRGLACPKACKGAARRGIPATTARVVVHRAAIGLTLDGTKQTAQNTALSVAHPDDRLSATPFPPQVFNTPAPARRAPATRRPARRGR